MDWKYGTKKAVSSSDELAAELAASKQAYCDDIFKVDPHCGVPEVIAARARLGARTDQSGEWAKTTVREEAESQMAAANAAAVEVASKMRTEPGSKFHATVYGHTIESWETDDMPGYRPDEVIVVVNRIAPKK